MRRTRRSYRALRSPSSLGQPTGHGCDLPVRDHAHGDRAGCGELQRQGGDAGSRGRRGQTACSATGARRGHMSVAPPRCARPATHGTGRAGVPTRSEPLCRARARLSAGQGVRGCALWSRLRGDELWPATRGSSTPPFSCGHQGDPESSVDRTPEPPATRVARPGPRHLAARHPCQRRAVAAPPGAGTIPGRPDGRRRTAVLKVCR
jgi:hypothetical protein